MPAGVGTTEGRNRKQPVTRTPSFRHGKTLVTYMPQLPIVLTHGYLGFGDLGPIEYFKGVVETLKQSGADQVFPVDVPPKGSLAQRSAALAQQIRKYVPSGKVHLIAHSMGGLDSRYLIAKGNGGELIASLTTLGSPFRGTFAADVVSNPMKLRNVGLTNLAKAVVLLGEQGVAQFPHQAIAELQFAADALGSIISRAGTSDYWTVSTYLRRVLALDDEALPELTTDNCLRIFPEDQSDLKGIPASSYAGLVNPASASAPLRASAVLLEAVQEANDGLVSVKSASLKDQRGTLPVDHLGLVGWGPADVSGCFREIYSRLPGQTA